MVICRTGKKNTRVKALVESKNISAHGRPPEKLERPVRARQGRLMRPIIGLTGADDTLLQSLHEFEETVRALRSEQTVYRPE